MPTGTPELSTGLPGLDRIFQGLRPGDNVVWQVDSIDDYVPFVKPFCDYAVSRDKRLIYFRFAKHAPLLTEDSGAEIYSLHPEAGFETFITRVHEVLGTTGSDTFCVFDAISELALDLHSDRMLGNFYLLTCPYIFARQSVAYFALLRDYHSYYAATPIMETTQVLVDVYRHEEKIFIHPRKVLHRYSPTMHTLHSWEGDDFRPLAESNEITKVLTSAESPGVASAIDRPGSWTRTFLQARELLEDFKHGLVKKSGIKDAFHRCVRLAVSDDERTLQLAEKYLSLEDVLNVQKRMLGSGLIGGKSAGMLLARAILSKADSRWNDVLEPHDSFFIGSEVYYSYLVDNQCWHLRQRQKNRKTFLDGVEEARQRIHMGTFSPKMTERFSRMLDYFGQAPIIVRSSSLLEDNFGNSFAGKYESVFCVNQGPKHIRLDEFMYAIRRIYASSMSEEALTYRADRGVLGQDEQMALLVQRVSGSHYGNLFFPQAAGVGFSFNPYVWNKEIDPGAGLVRLVFGLGTRAVDRVDDDYTRVVALNAPDRRPEATLGDVRRYTQRRVDVLDIETNQLASYDFMDVARKCEGLPLEIFASRDEELVRMAEEQGRPAAFPWLLTFDHLLSETTFVRDMREMLQILHDAYGCPVDIEFTLNFLKDGQYRINLLQCRPLQIKGRGISQPLPEQTDKQDLVMEARGAVIGESRLGRVDRFVYVAPEAYSKLANGDRHEVAKVIGRICHHDHERRPRTIMLIGPGRWGTGTPALGVPVTFRDIRPVSILCEIAAMSEDLIPDISLGTHFFSDLIETDILYVALFPDREENTLNKEFFEHSPNKLTKLLPDAEKWVDVIRVIDSESVNGAGVMHICADTVTQKFVCYRDRGGV